ncbi:hypothetical protein MMC18_009523 [Xylographa bjoerkii]|nr:hypothetical protein [Xylographa bjoerkii]
MAIKSLRVWLSQADAIVAESIITNRWARVHLRRIHARNSSIPFPINKLIGFFTSSPDEAEAVLNKIADAALEDSEKLQTEKLTEESYWKWIFRSHRKKVPAFDARMQMCAIYYAHTEKALTVISMTQSKVEEISAELLVFREQLEGAPMMLEGCKAGLLQLYIDILNAETERLEKSRRSSELIKEERMRKLEESVKFGYDDLPTVKHIVGSDAAVEKFQRQLLGLHMPGPPVS